MTDTLPDTPILLVSPIICPQVEDHPGPTIPTSAGTFRIVADRAEELLLPSLTLRAIRATLAAIVTARQASGDANLTYLDGLELFGEDDAPTLPDGLHPDGDGYLRIAERFAAIAFAPADPNPPSGFTSAGRAACTAPECEGGDPEYGHGLVGGDARGSGNGLRQWSDRARRGRAHHGDAVVAP